MKYQVTCYWMFTQRTSKHLLYSYPIYSNPCLSSKVITKVFYLSVTLRSLRMFAADTFWICAVPNYKQHLAKIFTTKTLSRNRVGEALDISYLCVYVCTAIVYLASILLPSVIWVCKLSEVTLSCRNINYNLSIGCQREIALIKFMWKTAL